MSAGTRQRAERRGNSLCKPQIFRLAVVDSYSKKCRFVKSFYDNTTYTYITVFPKKRKENPNTFISGLSYNNKVIYKAIIPKGTIYYQNRDGEYVSEKIIVTDELVKPNGKNYIEK